VKIGKQTNLYCNSLNINYCTVFNRAIVAFLFYAHKLNKLRKIEQL